MSTSVKFAGLPILLFAAFKVITGFAAISKLVLFATLFFIFLYAFRAVYLPDIPKCGSPLPFVGNTIDFYHNRLRINDWLTNEMIQSGNTLMQFSIIGQNPYLFIAQPKYIECVLKTHFNSFDKGPFVHDTMKELFGDGIFNTDGATWRHQRKTASYIFSSKNLRLHMTEVIKSNVNSLIDVLTHFAKKSHVLDIQKLFLTHTLDSFTDIAFGVKLGFTSRMKKTSFTTKTGNSDDKEIMASRFHLAFDNAIHAIHRRYIVPQIVWKFQRWLNVGTEALLASSVETIDTFIGDVIIRAKKAKALNVHNVNAPDIITLFVSKSVELSENIDTSNIRYLRDILVNFIIAGRDTTGETLSWTIYELSRHPKISERVYNEIQEKKESSFLEAIINETLRLHSPLPLAVKLCVKECMFPDGIRVEPGTHVVYSMYTLARMKFIWGEDAATFRPDRWLEMTKPVSPYEFLSFSAGPRQCLGKAMALLQIKLVLQTILQNFTITPLENVERTYGSSLTLPISGGLPVYVNKRPHDVS